MSCKSWGERALLLCDEPGESTQGLKGVEWKQVLMRSMSHRDYSLWLCL